MTSIVEWAALHSAPWFGITVSLGALVMIGVILMTRGWLRQ